VEPIDMASKLLDFSERNQLLQPVMSSESTEDEQQKQSAVAVDLTNNTTTTSSDTTANAASDNTTSSSSASSEIRPVEVSPPTATTTAPKYDISIFGSVPAEPADTDPETIKISIRLPTKRLMRKWRQSDTVRNLFAYIIEMDNESAQRPFDLTAPGSQNEVLSSKLDETLATCQLKGSLLQHKWV
jgi:hypothetical protein